MSKRNDDNNSIVQALLDLQDAGLGSRSVSDLIAYLAGNRTLKRQLQDKWDSHAYNDRTLTFAMIYENPAIMCLSDLAVKILWFLATTANQSGCIQVSTPVLSQICGYKRTKVTATMRELEDAGVITVVRPPTRHDAPVYMINPAVSLKGKRSRHREQQFRNNAVHAGNFKGLQLNVTIATEVVSVKGDPDTDTPGYKYTRVYIDDTEKGPADANSANPMYTANAARSRKHHKADEDDPSIPVQLSIYDL
jgi:hypothetical protein